MSEHNYGIGYLTPAEKRRSELTMKENTMLPTGASNPNYPSVVNAENERRQDELHADSTQLLEVARRIADVQEFIGTLTPTSNEGVDATAVAAVFAEEFHNSVEEDCREISAEAVRDWLASQARINQGNVEFHRKIAGGERETEEPTG